MFRSSFIVMAINMISRLLGLIREMIIGSLFGATGLTDAYISATRIPNFFTTLFGEGSLGTVFIPIYNKALEEDGDKKAKEFLYSLLNLIVVFTSTISLIIFIFSKKILNITTAFNDIERLEIADKMLKIVAFYFLFIALSGVISSFLNNYRKFIVAASMGIVFNLTIIIGTLITKNTLGIYGLGVAYLFSGVFQLLIMMPSFFQIVKNYKLILNINNKYVIEMFTLMIPTLIGIFGYQFNEIIDNRFATMLKSGTVSALNYASRLYLLPIGVFAISLSVVVFPELSKSVVKKKYKRARKVVEDGLNLLAFLIIPSMFILYNFSKEIIILIYMRGNFNWEAVNTTSETLQYYALGLLFFSSIHLLTRSHYVFKDRKLPVISSFIGIFVNILLDYLLYKNYKHIGLTFATSFSAMINYFILLFSLRKRYLKINIKKYLLFIILSVITSFISCIFSMQIGEILFSSKYVIIFKIFIFGIIYLLQWIILYKIKNKYL